MPDLYCKGCGDELEAPMVCIPRRVIEEQAHEIDLLHRRIEKYEPKPKPEPRVQEQQVEVPQLPAAPVRAPAPPAPKQVSL